MGDSLDGSENTAEAQNVVVVEFQDFANYLRRAATVLLPEDDIVPPALNTALDDKVYQDCIRKFISDSQVSSLFVQRFSLKEDDNEQPTEGEEEKEAVTYQISNERGAVIEADKSIHSQLRLINLSDGSPYETLHAFISKTMAPFFKSYVKESVNSIFFSCLPCRAADEGRKPRVADFGDKVEDSTFLNQLQNGVNRWIKEIQKVTKLDRDPSNGTALQEISFWLNLERALHRIQEKRESIEALATVSDFNPLMKDFPINDLLSATELERISDLAGLTLTKLCVSDSELAISAKESATPLRSMSLSPTDPSEVLSIITKLKNSSSKKRDEHLKMVWRVSPSHKRLQARMEHMRRFRRHHEQLRTVMLRVLRPRATVATDVGAGGEPAQPLSLPMDAADANAIAETRITAHLRDQLGTAKNANEMFRIFSRFNALFVRPHIRGAIREYQTQLIQRLCRYYHQVQYPQSKCSRLSLVRDLPPVAGSIIWAKQIDHQLTAYLKRVEDVLGQKLKADGDSFRLKLDTQEVFDDWARKVTDLSVIFLWQVQQRNLGVSGRIFAIESVRARSSKTGTVLKLKVNFLPEIITLYKETCPYSASSLADILSRLQRAIDDLSLRQYSNLHLWVQRLDEEVEKSLAARLQSGIEAWTMALLGKVNELDLSMDTYSPAEPTHKPGGEPQQMYLFPSLEEARFQLMRQMFAWQAIVTSQHRLQSTRYQVGVARAQTATYRNLLTKLPGGSNPVENAYDAIEQKISQVREYVDEWLRYQALWDLQPDSLYGRLGEDITLWIKCLNDIKKSRTTFDTSDTRREYGPVVIDFARVQSKVALKYDAWHKEVLGKFGALLGGEMVQFHGRLAKSRSQLEHQSIGMLNLKREVLAWEKQVDIYREAQRILERQRFQFPAQWLHVDNIEGEWSAFNEIMRRKDSSIQTQFLTEWERSKPTDGSTRPEDALTKLQAMETRYTRLKEERDNVAKAKEALELHDTDLRGVWASLSKIWTQIDDIREKPWLSVQPRKLRQQLEAMLNELKELPARLRMYDSYEYVRKLLQSYTKVNMLIVELKSDALKERHWRQLCRALKVDWSLSELTLGQVWDADLLHNEHTNKCKIIRGWDDLFNKVKEHINSVAAMKLSPYYKVFEEEALTWEEKLNRINALFDVWIDVQRRWVYLEGIFSGSADIKTLLPVETSRFQSISFYFVGDEDLLEIIGNSKNIARLQKHFKKMFAVENPKINSWLSMVEREMRVTLACRLKDAVGDVKQFKDGNVDPQKFIDWCDKYQAQIVVLAAQILWSEDVDAALVSGGGDGLKLVLAHVENMLNILADSVLQEQPPLRRRKLEHLINEFVHKRTVTRRLIASDVNSARSFEWLCEMRFYFDPRNNDYLGVQDRLVQTPLTDRCYLTMTQALEARLGGSPFGPAGTGKTESVKALGNQLGRFVLVFNCDETFDFQAMGRIFVGLCQVGAWGCFDEFNRLEERMLSAVSQQVQTIQEALKSHQEGDNTTSITVELVGKQVRVSQDMAIFITMNPGYAGRSNLPDNLKKLFRSLAMTTPDRQLIAEVMLLCDEQLSNQSHYDFGLRALKSVLVSAGNVKRDRIQKIKRGTEVPDEASIAESLPEQDILIQSVCETMVPKLVAEDIPLLFSLLNDVFPNVGYTRAEMTGADIPLLFSLLNDVFSNVGYIRAEMTGADIPLLFSLLNDVFSNVGYIRAEMTGADIPLLFSLLNDVFSNVGYIRAEMTGADIPLLFSLLNDVFSNVGYIRAEMTGAEDIPLLFSLLNDVFPNVGYTRAEMTVCAEEFLVCGEGDEHGSTWMEKVLQLYQICKLNHGLMMVGPSGSGKSTAWRVLLKALERFEGVEGVAHVIDPKAMSKETLYGVLDPNTREWTDGLFTHILRKIIDNVRGEINKRQWIIFDGDVDPEWVENLNSVLDDNKLLTLPNGERLSLPPNVRVMFEVQDLKYATLATVSRCGMVWFSQDVLTTEMIFENYLMRLRNIPLEDGEEDSFSIVMAAPTAGGLVVKCLERAVSLDHIMDFTRHRALSSLHSMLNRGVRNILGYNRQHPDFPVTNDQLEAYVPKWLVYSLLWSFAGDAKLKDRNELGDFIRSASTMQLPNCGANQHIIDFEVAAPDVVVPTLDTVRHEALLYTWLAEHKPLGKYYYLFNLEMINLPDMDQYGTQRVISFLRQLLEHKGFFRASDHSWVHLERIQFVGACNPPTDPGRKPLSHRLLRHVPVIYVDYPGETSLEQIYGTFTRAMLRMQPALRGYAEPLTQAMVKLYLQSQERFTQDMQPHYVPLDNLSVEGLVRLWAHEALRLFQDRLVEDSERQWTDENIDNVAMRFFPGINREQALARPILYSNWLSKDYVPVLRDQLREYVKARLKVRQPQGHLLLIGVSGAGKTTLSRFVAWMNGLSIFQIKVHNKYTGADFDEDLRSVLRRAGCRDEKVAFILDESNVPGLFEGDEFAALMTQCKEGAQREGLMLDSNDELYKWFTGQVMRNLHVVFTMNPSSEGLKDRAATSPALFNRCVLNWFGDWSDGALFQVGKEFTSRMDLDSSEYVAPDLFPAACSEISARPQHREAVVNACVYQMVKLYAEKRADLEEQQLHLNVGLGKIAETVEQMVKDQQEAEKKKVESQEIQVAIEKQTKEIEAKRRDVMADLAQVEPAVIEAQNAVKSIKKQHLVEVRSMGNPPALVKVALESICLILGENATDWKAIRAVIMRENFINSIVSNFSTEDITDDVREKMKTRYLSNPDYNFEKVNRASMACGPMVKWAIAQIEYADMLKRVEPLRNELQALEDQAQTNVTAGSEVSELISQLEKSIASYKEDSETFRSQMSTIVGDVLLSAAFIAYGGYFDQHYRQNLFSTWTAHLAAANIRYRADIARTEYLSNPDERLRWQANALPTDELVSTATP
ncbi:Dynein heavy chain [Operophtera brumata]|uniref:Dynein heavy chain n=1 Tax=Operophtera brumata TaxID=104452 RepID=A0A0L7LQW6_OPEBR|nr:Dynein heavy chain [Operophtera brumata]